jgi:NAD+ synthase (glutamine-hydrolysing)
MKINLASSNLNQTPLSWDKNFKNIKNSIKLSIKKNVDILCLPELSITGYGCQDLFFNKWFIKKSDNLLIEISKICKSITVIVGHPLFHKNKLYNVCCIIKNKEILGFFVKSNIPNDGVHYEKRWFSSWEFGNIEKIKFNNKEYPIGSIQLEYNNEITLGFEICRDSWDNERPANYIKTKKNLIIFNPIASHYAFKKFDFRKDLVIKSSKKFNCTYMSVNLLGNESGKIIFEGDSILAQKGKLLDISKRFSFEDFSINFNTINLEGGNKKYNEIPTNIYEEFIDIFSLSILDYLSKSKLKGYGLSLSGGLDSSCIAILIYEMVKRFILKKGSDQLIKRLNLKEVKLTKDENENHKLIVNKILFTAYQKSENSSKETQESAKLLSKFIGSKHYEWDIDEEVESIIKKISSSTKKTYSWDNDNIALQNIQARVRSPFIWFIANTNNLLLLSTSNRSESSVGYSTMDGDSSGSISPISGIDKIFIKKLLNYLIKKYNYYPLKNVLSLKPSAELKPIHENQIDENDLMPYEILNLIEKLAIKERLSPYEVFLHLQKEMKIEKKLSKTYVKKFYKKFSMNQWKRERTAPSFHFDEFSVDSSLWLRFPILSNNFKEELKNL